jgi:hypothetical protein
MSKSFAVRKDAMEWGRQMEVKADRTDLPTDPKALERVTLGYLVRRYRDTVSPRKKTGETETIVLNAFLSRQICSRRLSEHPRVPLPITKLWKDDNAGTTSGISVDQFNKAINHTLFACHFKCDCKLIAID